MNIATYNSQQANWNEPDRAFDFFTNRANQIRIFASVTVGSNRTQVIEILAGIHKEDETLNDETRYLLSIPGMLESLIECRNTPIEDFEHEIKW